MNIKLYIKPLSVNAAWKGRRFKTDKYNRYEKEVLAMLPDYEIKAFRGLVLTFGFSNVQSDIDNPTKLIIDILQKRYGVNDRDLTELHLYKIKVAKGNEFIKIELIE
jgi:Holliday junction resolvase RusA-like endonuclease